MVSRAEAEYNENIKAQKQRWDERFIRSVTRLFALAGPHLRTLCIVQDFHLRWPHFPIDTLPKLQELSVDGPSGLFLSPGETSTGSSALESTSSSSAFILPSLQRLHYVASYKPGPSSILDLLAKHAPMSLTHLRFSGLNFSIGDFPLNLARHLGAKVNPGYGVMSSDEASPPTVAARFANLCHIVTHGDPPAPGG